MARDHLIVNHSWFSPPTLKALEARGIVLHMDTWQSLPAPGERLLGAAIWFYDALRHPLLVARLKRRLASEGVPLFAWNQDAPHYLNRAQWRLNWLDRARLLDVYASHSLLDPRRFADSVLLLPNAADTSRYHLSGTTLAELRNPNFYDYDVSFFGAMDGDRYKEMRQRQDFFAALGKRLQQRNIRFLFRESSDMSIADQVRLIQRSRINLNFGASCDYGSPVASGLPERCFGIPACGGFLLCDKRSHAIDSFTPGRNWAEFESLDDCVAKIDHWLAHFAASRDLAEDCHAHVLKLHTYVQRAERLHQALLAWHVGKRGLL